MTPRRTAGHEAGPIFERDRFLLTVRDWPWAVMDALPGRPGEVNAFCAARRAMQVRLLPGRAFLLAGDLGERREGLGVGVVVKHVLASPLRAVGVPAGRDHLGGCRQPSVHGHEKYPVIFASGVMMATVFAQVRRTLEPSSAPDS